MEQLDPKLVDLLFVALGAGAVLIWNFVIGLLKRLPNYDEIEQMTQRMVEAAQQMAQLSNEEKYNYVVEQLSAWLKTKGWDISPELIHIFVESAVRLLRREEKKLGVAVLLDGLSEDEEEDAPF